jgi:hypothetical protein
MEQTACYETLAIKLHTPENNPKENNTTFKTRRKSETKKYKLTDSYTAKWIISLLIK